MNVSLAIFPIVLVATTSNAALIIPPIKGIVFPKLMTPF